jgi:hypothetical protein
MRVMKKSSWAFASCLVMSMIVQSSDAATSPVGRTMKFYESSATRIARFWVPEQTCTPTAQISCVSLNQYGYGSFADIEMASVTVSGSLGRSTLCANPNGQAIYVFKRTDPNGWDLSSLSFDYRYELQSSVLNDPSLINRRTGLPFNGKLTFPEISAFLDQDFMGPSQRIVRNQRIASLECGYPLVTYGNLMSLFGLSSFDAQRVLSGSVTIKLFIAGSLMQTEGANISMTLRMIGD